MSAAHVQHTQGHSPPLQRAVLDATLRRMTPMLRNHRESTGGRYSHIDPPDHSAVKLLFFAVIVTATASYDRPRSCSSCVTAERTACVAKNSTMILWSPVGTLVWRGTVLRPSLGATAVHRTTLPRGFAESAWSGDAPWAQTWGTSAGPVRPSPSLPGLHHSRRPRAPWAGERTRRRASRTHTPSPADTASAVQHRNIPPPRRSPIAAPSFVRHTQGASSLYTPLRRRQSPTYVPSGGRLISHERLRAAGRHRRGEPCLGARAPVRAVHALPRERVRCLRPSTRGLDGALGAGASEKMDS